VPGSIVNTRPPGLSTRRQAWSTALRSSALADASWPRALCMHHQVEGAVIERKAIERPDANLDQHSHLLGAAIHLHASSSVATTWAAVPLSPVLAASWPASNASSTPICSRRSPSFHARHRDRERVDIEPAKREQRHSLMI
jgi:hypothetical protein